MTTVATARIGSAAYIRFLESATTAAPSGEAGDEPATGGLPFCTGSVIAVGGGLHVHRL